MASPIRLQNFKGLTGDSEGVLHYVNVVSALHLVIIPEMQALPNFVPDERHLANRQNLFSF